MPPETETAMEPDFDLTPVLFIGLLLLPAGVSLLASIAKGGRRG